MLTKIKNYKQLVIGLIIGISISTIIPVGAETVKLIQVKPVDVKYQVNGEVVDIKTQPFSYNYYNYAPARPIVEAMGGDIKMNETGDTVIINTKLNTNDTKNTTKNSDLNNVEQDAETKTTPDGLTAKKYDNKYYIPVNSFNEKYGRDRNKKYDDNYMFYSIQTYLNDLNTTIARLIKTNRTMQLAIYTSDEREGLKREEIILDNIPIYKNKWYYISHIEYDYYIKNILPLLIN